MLNNQSGNNSENAEKINSVRKEYLKWFDNKLYIDEYCLASDGVKLHGRVYLQKDTCDKWVFCLHGYFGNMRSLAPLVKTYLKNGYNVFVPELRGHGESEFKCVGMAYLDSRDVERWYKLLIDKYSIEHLVIHGISMGATTAMMCTVKDFDGKLENCICDCGFTSAKAAFKHIRKTFMHLPNSIVFWLGNLISKIRCGYFYGQCSGKKALKKTTVPVLFLHGGLDNFVPVRMVIDNYNVCASKKDWYIFPNAEHFECMYADEELYWVKVFGFIDNIKA